MTYEIHIKICGPTLIRTSTTTVTKIMADSDDEYVQDASDDDVDSHRVSRAGVGGSVRTAGINARGGSGGWEVTRTWENVVEGADGTISSTVEGLLEASKRKRSDITKVSENEN